MAYSTFTLTGTYHLFDGTACTGSVDIIPSVKTVKDTTGNVVLSGRLKVTLTAGAFSVTLPNPNDATLQPSAFGYTVAPKLDDARTRIPTVSFGASQVTGSSLDMQAVTPADISLITPTVQYAQAADLTAETARATAAEGTKVNSSTYTAGLAAKANVTETAAIRNLTDSTLNAGRSAAYGTSEGNSWLASTAYAKGAIYSTPRGQRRRVQVAYTSGASFAQADYDNSIALSRAPKGNRVSWLTDSIGGFNGTGDNVATFEGNANNYTGRTIWLSLGRLEYGRVFSTGGLTVAQIRDQVLPRLLAVPISQRPDVVMVQGGTNDAGAGTFQIGVSLGALRDIETSLNQNGMLMVCCTIPPRGDASSAQVKATAWNVAVRGYARRRGLDLIDYAQALTDPANGHYKSGLDDGSQIHPSFAGMAAMADQAITTQEWHKTFPARTTPLVLSNADPNLPGLTDPMCLVDNGTGQSNGVSISLGTGGTKSLTTRTGWQTITCPSTAAANSTQGQYYGDFSFTSLGTAASAGATTLTMANNYISRGDVFTLGTGGTQERVLVVAISGTTLTLAAPLLYPHANGTPLVWAVTGDLISASVRFACSGITGQSAVAGINLTVANGNTDEDGSAFYVGLDGEGVFNVERTCLSTTTRAKATMILGKPTSGTATLQWTQMTVRNVTARAALGIE